MIYNKDENKALLSILKVHRLKLTVTKINEIIHNLLTF